MPKLNVQQNNANVIKALRNALAIGQIKGPIASDGNDNFTSTGSNRNLLDNAYFVGGGSQLGDGVFPINQRGQTSYAGGSGIDRWVSDSQITLTASGITISANALFQNQSKEFFDGLLGKTVTYSILTTGGEIKSATIQFPSSYPASIQVQEIFNDGQSSIGFALFPAGNGQVIRIIGVPVAAAKLELGTVSTLANDTPPDFYLELEKAKAHYFHIADEALVCLSNSSANTITVYIPVTTTMASNVSIQSVTGAFLRGSGVNGVPTLSASNITLENKGNMLKLNITNFGVTIAGTTIYMLNFSDLVISDNI